MFAHAAPQTPDFSGPVYELTGVTKIYPGQTEPANLNINLAIERGEIFGFLGDNGAGKTTLVRQMVNLLKTSEGQIRLFGCPVHSSRLLVPAWVGYMPQESNSLNNMTVSEAFYYTARLRGRSRHDSAQERDRLLAIWSLGDLRDRPSVKLSGGQRRLLRLAVAMAGSPPVLILDEPTNDLDPQRRRWVWDCLREENTQRGTTIIFITHDAIEAEKVIRRVGILRRGELVALGKPAELKRQVDRQLRLELFFPPDCPPDLPAGLVPQPVQPGRWLIYLEWGDAAGVLDQLNLAQLDDFRLYSATLEDLYLHYAR